MIKIQLPNAISTIEEAKKFLRSLHNIGADYHCEDDANDIKFLNLSEKNRPTADQCNQLNKLMEDIYNLPGNDGKHDNSIIFCPCGFLLRENEIYLVKDLTGRGYSGKLNANQILEQIGEIPEEEQDGEDVEITENRELLNWIQTAEDGDEFTNNSGTEKYIRIQ